MKRLLAATLGLAVATLTFPAGGRAAESCPAEVAQAKAALTGAQASLKKNTQVVAKSQEIQAPRSQQDIQAPRVTKAGALVRQAEAACKKGDATLAARKAREALALLGK